MDLKLNEDRLSLSAGDVQLSAVLVSPQEGSAESIAIMLHGGPGGEKDGPSQLYSNLAAELAGAGVASIRFDFRGVGESSGRYRDMTISSQTKEYEAVFALCRHMGFSNVAVIGESYGGTIAVRSRTANPDAVVLLWPAIDFFDVTFAPFATPQKMELARRDGYTVEDGDEIGLAFLEELHEVRDVWRDVKALSAPTLLIHGTGDVEVPYSQSERAHDLIRSAKKLVLVDGADHCMREPEERVVVNQEIVDWLASHL